MSEKNVLIITYYWPPSGGSGVQRWLKFVKYLPQFGYTPYVFTPENPSFNLRDESLLNDVPPEAEVIHFPIWEPYGVFQKASGKTGGSMVSTSSNTSIPGRLAVWIRGNLIIPDPRVFWVRPSVKFLNDFIRDKGIKVIITTGPPHSMHLIGWKLRKRNPSLRWIADFRDPWSTWGLLDTLKAGKMARYLHRYLEKAVLQRADKVITITPFYARKFAELGERKVDLVTNGFDEDDFRGMTIRRSQKFLMRHVGTVNEKCDPRPLLLAVKQLASADMGFASAAEVNFIGDVHPEVRAYVAGDPALAKLVTFTAPVSHNELMAYYEESSLLLIILTGYRDAEGYMPGKLFEYLATGLPVLGTGPEDGNAAMMLKETATGTILDGRKTPELVAQLSALYAEWVRGDFHTRASAAADKFSRRALTRSLVEIITSLE